MWLLSLAWKNLWRNKARTMITMSAVFFAVVLSVFTSSLKEGIFDNLIKNVVSFYTGYIQIHQKGFWDEQVLDNAMENAPSVAQKIISNKNVAGVSLRLESFGLISSDRNTKGCMVVGIDPNSENLVTALKQKLIEGAYLTANDEEVLLSEGLAKQLNTQIKDTIYIIGQGYHGATAAGRFRVKGLVRFGSPQLNNQVIYLSAFAAQELYSAQGMATTMVVLLKNPDQLKETAADLRQILGNQFEVMAWDKILPDVKQHIETDSANMKYVQGILYMLVSFGIFGTLLMMMVERKFEMGMLVAIGMKKNKLCLLMIIESLLTVTAGCILGILASIPIVQYFQHKPMRMGGEIARIYEKFGFEAVFPTSTKTQIFMDQGILVMGIGLLLSIYPVYKIIKLNPTESMKR